jgi:hypothetical protein
MKYKVAAVFSFLIGLFEISLTLLLYFSVAPKLQQMYSDLGDQTQVNILFPSVVILIISAINFYLAKKVMSKEMKVKNKYFILAIAYAIVSLFLTGLLTAGLVSMTVFPIYSLTEKF